MSPGKKYAWKLRIAVVHLIVALAKNLVENINIFLEVDTTKNYLIQILLATNYDYPNYITDIAR